MSPPASPAVALRRTHATLEAAEAPALDTIGPLVHAVAKSWREELDRRRGRSASRGSSGSPCYGLARAPGFDPARTRRRARHRRTATVALVDRMERDNLVERVPVPGDRRRNAVRATPASRRLFTRIEAAATVLRQEVLGSLTGTSSPRCSAC
jgi:hypothetical protein